MQLLIIGGTVFLGRHLAEAAVARGHSVVLFNRGQHNADLFPELEKLRGDRDPSQDAGRGLAQLRARHWDAVIDTSGYVPRVVRAAAEALAGAAHYTFISTISVYPHFRVAGIDEHVLVATLDDPTVEDVTGETYGPLKAQCEAEVSRVFGERALIIRPGLIVGPHDPSDRFTYWVDRVARGGEVLAPQPPERPVQLIDARDLAAWTIQQVEARQAGVYNATGPATPLGFEQLLETCRAAAGGDARFTWVGEEFLLEQGVEPWVGLPLWIPSSDADTLGFGSVSCSKALNAGLAFRELAATVRDTLAWCAARGAEHQWRAGIGPARERELLGAWHARGG